MTNISYGLQEILVHCLRFLTITTTQFSITSHVSMTMPVDTARAKAREVERSLEQQHLTGERTSVNSGIERRTTASVHLRGPIPHGNRGLSSANALALPSRDPRLAHYPSGFAGRLSGSNDASHLAPKDIASNGSYQNQDRSNSRATTTVNNDTSTQSPVVNAKGNSGNSLRIVRHPMYREPASVPLLPVPAQKSIPGSKSNPIPIGASDLLDNGNSTSPGGKSKSKNANLTPLGRPSIPASTNANPVAKSSKLASANTSVLNAPHIPDHDIEVLHSQNSITKKRAISSGPPTTQKAYQDALATLKTGKIDWRATYITHVDFIFETDEFPPPPKKKKKLSSNTASPVPTQPEKQPKDSVIAKEQVHQPKTVNTQQKDAAAKVQIHSPKTVNIPQKDAASKENTNHSNTVTTSPQAAAAAAKAETHQPPRLLSGIARTAKKLDVDEVVDLGVSIR